jgi:hypothetical protein
MSSLTLEFENVLFHSEHPPESLKQEDHGMKSYPVAPWETITFHGVKWTYLCKENLHGKLGRIPIFNCLDTPFSFLSLRHPPSFLVPPTSLRNTGRKSVWPRATGPSLLKRHYSSSSVSMGRRRPSLLWSPSSDGRVDVICPSLLESTVATGVPMSAHPLLLDRKHNLHLICKRRHNLKQNTICILQHTSSSYKS